MSDQLGSAAATAWSTRSSAPPLPVGLVRNACRSLWV